MLFGNPHSMTVQKQIQGVNYVCPPGELVDIPDKYAYVIKTEGVMLVPADELTVEKPALVVTPEPVQETEAAKPRQDPKPQDRRDRR